MNFFFIMSSTVVVLVSFFLFNIREVNAGRDSLIEDSCKSAQCEIFSVEVNSDTGKNFKQERRRITYFLPDSTVPQVKYVMVDVKETVRCIKAVLVPRDTYLTFLYALRMVSDEEGNYPTTPTLTQQAWLRHYVNMANQTSTFTCAASKVSKSDLERLIPVAGNYVRTEECQEPMCQLFKVVEYYNTGDPITTIERVERNVNGRRHYVYQSTTRYPRAGCAKVVNTPKVIFNSYLNAIRMVPDEDGLLPPELNLTQQAWIKFFVSMTDQTKKFDCKSFVDQTSDSASK